MSWTASQDNGSEAGLEQHTGAVKPLADSAWRQPKMPGDVFRLPVLQILQYEHDSMRVGQLVEGTSQALPHLLPLDEPVRLGFHLPLGQVLRLQVVASLVEGPQDQRLRAFHLLDPHKASPHHQRRIQADLVAPAAEAAAALEPGQIAMNAHEGVLKRILRISGIAQDAVDPVVEEGEVGLDKRAEGG